MNGSDRRDRREAFIVFALLKAQYYTISILRRDDGFHADGIVDEFEEVRPLRRIGVVHEQPRGDLAPIGIEHMACVRTADAPSPRDHLPPVPVVAEELDNAFHVDFASIRIF